jgi:hypothetical protein
MSWFISNPISAAKSDTPQRALLASSSAPTFALLPSAVAITYNAGSRPSIGSRVVRTVPAEPRSPSQEGRASRSCRVTYRQGPRPT